MKIEGCYAALLDDCKGPISDEHYISESILKLLAAHGGLLVNGRKVNIEEVFHAKILCKFHNESLSSIDKQALSFFSFFDELENNVGHFDTHHGFSWQVKGKLIERWILKMLLGIVVTGEAQRFNTDLTNTNPPAQWVDWLFAYSPMSDGSGLYMLADKHANPFSFKGMGFTTCGKDNILGMLFNVHGFAFLLALVTPGPDSSLLEGAEFHPIEINVGNTKDTRIRSLKFTWTGSIFKEKRGT